MMLIDPPVTPFSPVEEIIAWQEELKGLDPAAPEVAEAVAQAAEWRQAAEARAQQNEL